MHTYSPLWMFLFESLRVLFFGRCDASLDKRSAIFAASVDQHFLENVYQWPTFLLCMLVNDVHLPRNEGQSVMCCSFSHHYVSFAWEVRVCLCLCVITRHAVFFINIIRGLFLVPPETNISWKMSVNDQHFCSMCLSLMLICPEMKDKHVLHFCLPLCMFAWEVWVCLCLCVLTGHAVFFIDNTRWLFWCRGRPRFLEKCLSMTNISRKMPVNDQHFFKNVCQWPTFLEKCLSKTDISWKMSVNHQHFSSKRWLMTFFFPLHPYSPLWMFFFESLRVWFLGRSHPSCSISPRLFSLPRFTNISWKMCNKWPTCLL